MVAVKLCAANGNAPGRQEELCCRFMLILCETKTLSFSPGQDDLYRVTGGDFYCTRLTRLCEGIGKVAGQGCVTQLSKRINLSVRPFVERFVLGDGG